MSSLPHSSLGILSFRYYHLLRWLVTQITRTHSMHEWITGQKLISDLFPVRTMATWNRMRPRGSLQVSGNDFDGLFLLTIILLLQIVSAFLYFFFFSVELINDSASNSRSFRINARFVRRQLYSRMWKLSSLLCCQYITVCSQPYKMPLRPCLFCISTPSLPPSFPHPLAHIYRSPFVFPPVTSLSGPSTRSLWSVPVI